MKRKDAREAMEKTLPIVIAYGHSKEMQIATLSSLAKREIEGIWTKGSEADELNSEKGEVCTRLEHH